MAGPNIAAKGGQGASTGKGKGKGEDSPRGDAGSAPPAVCTPVHGLRFASEPPRALAHSLPFCASFSHNTCCNTTNAQEVFGRHLALLHSRVKDSCALVSESMACYPCHPLVGTGALATVCLGLCNRWLEGCGDEFYAVSVDGKLQPCHENALVCSRLKDVFPSGVALCDRMGYRVAGPGTPCYDGSVDPSVKGAPVPKAPSAADLLSKLRSAFGTGGAADPGSGSVDPYEVLATLAVVLVLGVGLWKGTRLYRQFSRRHKEAAARRALMAHAADARRSQ